MKIIIVSIVLAMVILATQGFTVRPDAGRPGRPSFPTFPGQGPFNPRPTFPKGYPRFRRDEGEVAGAEVQPLQGEVEHQSSTASVKFDHKAFDGSDKIVTEGVARHPERRDDEAVGIRV